MTAATASSDAASAEDLKLLIEDLYTIGTSSKDDGTAVKGGILRLDAAETVLQACLIKDAQCGSVEMLRAMARLGTVAGRPFPIAKYFSGFLEEYGGELDTLRDGETIADRALKLREVLLCFHHAGINSERLSMIYGHIERDFPRIEAAGALLPMSAAVRLCHTMLSTELSSAPATVTLLRSALREPLMYFEDDSQELRLLKMIEMLLRVDFLATQEKLPREVSEYLSVVRSLRYYDRDLRRDTPLTYQLAFFLRKHKVPVKRKMLGPYALKVCDPEERINFEAVAERSWRPGIREEPPARKRRHLEAVGWRHIEVHEQEWNTLETYEAKAAHVRKLLKDNDLIDP